MNFKYADIKVGYDCNNDCIHCVIADQRRAAKKLRGNENRNVVEYKNEILDSKKKGCEKLIVTGGEPTIRKDFIDIVKFAKQQELEVILQTNGRAFSSYDFLEKANLYIDAYMIALHGSSEEVHDKITRSKNSFNQAINGIKNLVEAKARVGVKVVISNYNFKDLLNIVKLCDSLNVEYLNIAFPHANGNALEYFDEIIPYYKDIQKSVEECIDYAEGNNFNLDFEAILPCALSKNFSLNYFLDLKSKSTNELKQLDSKSLDWNVYRVGSKKKGVVCSKCLYNNFCEGYWEEYVDKRGFNEFIPVTKITPELREIFLNKLKSWKR